MNPITAPQLPTLPMTGPRDTGEHGKELQAAREFEAIFVRKMLSSLEKMQHVGSEKETTGSSIYGSMLVGAVADMATQGEGLGLSALVLQALTPATTESTAPLKPGQPDK